MKANVPKIREYLALICEPRHTVFIQTHRMAKHEIEHLEQIEALP